MIRLWIIKEISQEGCQESRFKFSRIPLRRQKGKITQIHQMTNSMIDFIIYPNYVTEQNNSEILDISCNLKLKDKKFKSKLNYKIN